MFAPRKTEHERQYAAPASSLRERRQWPGPEYSVAGKRAPRAGTDTHSESLIADYAASAPPLDQHSGHRAHRWRTQQHVTGVSDRHVVQFPRAATSADLNEPASAKHASHNGGFAPCEAFQRRVAGVSNPRMAQIPPTSLSRPLKRAATAQPDPHLVTPRTNAAPTPTPRQVTYARH